MQVFLTRRAQTCELNAIRTAKDVSTTYCKDQSLQGDQNYSARNEWAKPLIVSL